jgi:chromosome partitioning protein
VNTRVIAIVNQKGGVGKSTTALSIGAVLHQQGGKVLYVDLDAQGNLTHTSRADNTGAAMLMMTGQAQAGESLQQTVHGDIIASSPLLSGADDAIKETGREYRLREALKPLIGKYDYIVIDTPPVLGVLTVNALTAANDCIIPSQADTYSLLGINQLYSTITAVKTYCNQSLKVSGIVLTRYNGRAIIGRQAAATIAKTAETFGTKLYKAKISECTAIKESQVSRQSIIAYAPKSKAAIEYAELVNEILADWRTK